MNRKTHTTSDPATPPPRIAALLHVVRILLAYGRHLADTIADRATAPAFTPIAACFGTLDLALILPRLHRGILRAVALERVLLARAARGRDLAFPTPRASPGARPPAPRPARRTPRAQPTAFHTPTLQQLERQARRRPPGRTIADICRDLAVVPGLCTGAFWNELFDAMHHHGGSVAALMRERFHREQAFHRQQDRTPTQAPDPPTLSRQTVPLTLGFFIGEPPMTPPPLAGGGWGEGARTTHPP